MGLLNLRLNKINISSKQGSTLLVGGEALVDVLSVSGRAYRSLESISLPLGLILKILESGLGEIKLDVHGLALCR